VGVEDQVLRHPTPVLATPGGNAHFGDQRLSSALPAHPEGRVNDESPRHPLSVTTTSSATSHDGPPNGGLTGVRRLRHEGGPPTL
jgi:hypothetical protein